MSLFQSASAAGEEDEERVLVAKYLRVMLAG